MLLCRHAEASPFASAAPWIRFSHRATHRERFCYYPLPIVPFLLLDFLLELVKGLRRQGKFSKTSTINRRMPGRVHRTRFCEACFLLTQPRPPVRGLGRA